VNCLIGTERYVINYQSSNEKPTSSFKIQPLNVFKVRTSPVQSIFTSQISAVPIAPILLSLAVLPCCFVDQRFESCTTLGRDIIVRGQNRLKLHCLPTSATSLIKFQLVQTYLSTTRSLSFVRQSRRIWAWMPIYSP
jgi:hypothetical protein